MTDTISPNSQLPRSILVTGGARSGKTAHAQGLVEASGRTPLYLATAQAADGEMAERIARHQAERGPHWLLCEEPLDLGSALMHESTPDRAILVDCLTLWLSNLMFAGRNVEATTRQLLQVLPALPGPVIFVTNEVGSGIVPDNRLSRDFRDAQGRMNQAFARACDSAVLVVCGLAVVLK